MPKPGAPEAFRVLVKELQSLALDIRVLDRDNQEIDLKMSLDDDDIGLQPPVDDEAFSDVEVEHDFEGFAIDDADEDEFDFSLEAEEEEPEATEE